MSLTHKELMELKVGDSFTAGPLFSGLAKDEVHLVLVAKVGGDLHFSATYMGVQLGPVVYAGRKWGWGK